MFCGVRQRVGEGLGLTLARGLFMVGLGRRLGLGLKEVLGGLGLRASGLAGGMDLVLGLGLVVLR